MIQKLNKASATSDDVAKEETVSNTDTEKVGASSSDWWHYAPTLF